jgi:hypothetical protein
MLIGLLNGEACATTVEGRKCGKEWSKIIEMRNAIVNTTF